MFWASHRAGLCHKNVIVVGKSITDSHMNENTMCMPHAHNIQHACSTQYACCMWILARKHVCCMHVFQTTALHVRNMHVTWNKFCTCDSLSQPCAVCNNQETRLLIACFLYTSLLQPCHMLVQPFHFCMGSCLCIVCCYIICEFSHVQYHTIKFLYGCPGQQLQSNNYHEYHTLLDSSSTYREY